MFQLTSNALHHRVQYTLRRLIFNGKGAEMNASVGARTLAAGIRWGLQALICCMLLVGLPAKAELSWFSRANCVNNESITWEAFWTDYYWLYTYSWHFRYVYIDSFPVGFYLPESHIVTDGWSYTWRSAAIHWGEGFSGGWTVIGYHYSLDYGSGSYYLGTTFAVDCNLGEW